jgi:hypothetical protein
LNVSSSFNLSQSLTMTGNYGPANAIQYWFGGVTGSCTNAGGTCAPFEYIFNNSSITKTGAGPAMTWFDIHGNAGGAGLNGAAYGLNVDFKLNSTTGNASGSNYVAATAYAHANVNDNGTPGTPASNMLAMNEICTLESGATSWKGCSGQETDLSIRTGADVQYLYGLNIVLLSTNTVTPSVDGAALTVSSQGGAGNISSFNYAFEIGNVQGYMPLASGGTILGCKPHTGHGVCDDFNSNSTIAYGIDLSTLTFSSAAFKSTGFSVDGSGNAIVRLMTTSGFTVATLPAAGTAGRRAFVTDQNAACPAVGGTLTGGGAVKCPVFDNGTAWVSG